jgi:LAGLIDADG DNA endonuclease family
LGNTVGSLSEVQRQIIVGSLLGDGAMRCKTNALLEINHSSHQRSYVDWKYRHLAELVRNATESSRKQRVANRVPIRHPLASGADSVPTVLRDRSEADPRARAQRAHSGGVVHGRWLPLEERVYLNTQQYDETSQRTLPRLLREQWGIEGALNRDTSYYRVRISVAGTRKLARLIEPHLLEELRYKLPQ